MMRIATVLLLLSILFSFPVWSQSETVINSEGITYLDRGWMYSRTDEGGSSEWMPLDLPSRLQVESGDYVAVDMRSNFVVPSQLKGTKLYLFLGRRWASVKVFVNGIEVVSHGISPPDYHYHDALSINAAIPEGLLRYDEPNDLLMQMYYEYDRVNLIPPAFGFYDDFFYFDKVVNFMNVDLYRFLSFLSLFVALFYLMQFAVRPVERNNLVFSVVNIGLALYFLRMGYLFPWLPFIPFYGFSKAVFFPAFTLMTAFVVRYLEASKAGKLLPYFWFLSALSFFSILIFGKTNLKIDNIFAFSLFPLACEIVLMGIITVRAYRRGVPDTLPMLFGVILGGLIGSHDIIFMIMRVYPHFWVQGVGIFVFDMGIFASLAVRSMRLHDELELYSEKTEQKVFDRTRALQKANADLKDAIDAARHASQAKSRFLANISHEMRTPLNCIIGFSEMLGRSCTTKQQKNVDVILDESERLLTLINQLLDIEKIEAGKISLDSSPFVIAEFVNGVGKSFELQCAEKNLKWQTRVSPGVPSIIEADSFRLRQVLDNIVSNAVKFTSHGSVVLTVSVDSVINEHELVLKFTVTDTGIGIPKEQSDRIFESFEQGDSSRTRVYGGSGLGMTITKQLVGIMKGSIHFTSEVGSGSSFWFTLPCMVPGHNAFSAAYPGSGSESKLIQGNPRVLVVEDYPSNRVIARTHLESLGCRVEEAENGRQAIELVESGGFDLILMDIQMPEMDGVEATTYIRRSLGKENIPIIGLTANAFTEDLVQYRQAGMNGVITKPLRRESFLDEIRAWLTGKKEQASGQSAADIASGDDICDYPALLNEVEGQSEVAASMLNAFSESLARQNDIIAAAFAAEDWPLLHREIHSIKGGAMNVFAHPLSKSAAKAEASAKNRNKAELETLLPELFEAMGGFRTYLDQLNLPG